jgi:DNA-binding transcriptional MerR regulator
MSAELDIARLSIGQVLEELQPEFPSLTISKIRYLEDEALLKPERTPAGYRKFSFADVERLRFILTQQANYFPLGRIREMLDALDRNEVPSLNEGRIVTVPLLKVAADGLPVVDLFLEPRSQLRLSREELLESAGIDEETLMQAEEYGLVQRRPSQTYYDGDQLQAAALVGQCASNGLEPRHLRQFAIQADREADLIGQVVGPRTHGLDGGDAAEAAAAMAALAVRLHTVLVRNRLRT